MFNNFSPTAARLLFILFFLPFALAFRGALP